MKKILFILLFPIFAYSQGVIRIGTASGTDSYAVTFNPAITSLNTNTVYVITFTNANTSTTVTLDPAGAVAATAIKDNAGNNPAIGSIVAGGTYSLKYNGASFLIVGNGSFSGSYWPLIGTGTLTGTTTIDGNGNDLTITDIDAFTMSGVRTTVSGSDYLNLSGDTLRLNGVAPNHTGQIVYNVNGGPVWGGLNEIGTDAATPDITWLTKTTDYTPVATDTMFVNPGFKLHAAGAISFTIPPFATTDFPQGWQCIVYNDSSGTATIALGTGVAVETSATAPYTLAEDEYAVIIKDNSTNTWKLMMGNPSGGHVIEEEGTPVTQRSNMNFTGAGVAVTDAGGKTVVTISGGSGISNGAAANEIPKSDGTDLDPSGLESTTAGNLNLGLSATTGTARTITAAGSGTDLDFNIAPKGAGTFHVLGTSAPTAFIGTEGATVGYVKGATGSSGSNDGLDIELIGGLSYQASGNGNGGYAALVSGQGHGSGVDGIVVIAPNDRWVHWPNGGSNPTGLTDAVGTYVTDVTTAEMFIENEAGVVDQLTEQRQTLNSVYASTGNVTTGEDQLFSYTLPASRLRVDGQSVKGRFSGIVANNANSKTIRLKFGGTTIITRATTTPTIGQGWTLDWECIRTGSATQRCNGTFSGSDGIASAWYTTTTETLSGTVAIVLTGDATSTDDIIMHTSKVYFEP